MTHTGLYPRRPYNLDPKEFTLAYIDSGGHVVSEHGHIWWYLNWQELAGIIRGSELLCFSRELVEYSWFDEAIRDERATVLANRSTGIKLFDRDHRTWYIIPSELWGVPIPDPDFLRDMRQLFNLAGITKHTPGALGSYLMQSPWFEHEKKHLDQVAGIAYHGEEYWEPKQQHSYPGKAARKELKDHAIGSRVQVLGASRSSDIRVDMVAAFANHARIVPTGTTCRTTGDSPTMPCFTYYCRCLVTIEQPLDLAVFGVRDENGIKWPTQPGSYETWLWKEQVEDCLAAGLQAYRMEGSYWRESTGDLGLWADLMLRLEEEAPNNRVVKLLKLARNAAIGGMGIGEGKSTVIRDGIRKGDRPLVSRNGLTGLYVRTEPSEKKKTMVHWWNYTLAMTQRTLYHVMREYMSQGEEIVSVLTDCIVIRDTLGGFWIPDGFRMVE